MAFIVGYAFASHFRCYDSNKLFLPLTPSLLASIYSEELALMAKFDNGCLSSLSCSSHSILLTSGAVALLPFLPSTIRFIAMLHELFKTDSKDKESGKFPRYMTTQFRPFAFPVRPSTTRSDIRDGSRSRHHNKIPSCTNVILCARVASVIEPTP